MAQTFVLSRYLLDYPAWKFGNYGKKSLQFGGSYAAHVLAL